MKCPECEKEGKTSKLYFRCSFRTAMMGENYYDEDGKLHIHDPNTQTDHYQCSNGHEFMVSSKRGCEACGTKDEKWFGHYLDKGAR